MQKKITLKLLPSEAVNEKLIKNHIASSEAIAANKVSGFHIIKRSNDARGKQVWYQLSVNAFIDEPFVPREKISISFKDVTHSKKRILIIGAGPAGLFAALKFIELGIKPVIVDRGKDVRSRRRDLAILNKEGIINPESNYCFGEGGAGTYSDGKLYTRSTKRGDITRILNLLVYFGAEENILFEAHPHIGTNKLPGIITAIRKKIIDCGGEVHFETKLTDLNIADAKIKSVVTNKGDHLPADAFLLATGHSARDIFLLLYAKKIFIEFKPFALGVRVEHPQEIIDSIQYHCLVRDSNLPPSSYSLVHQANKHGVFSFCMCPGGIIATASTEENELVVNGWSPSKRNNPFANSGMVVTCNEKDIKTYIEKYGVLGGMHFQRSVESKAFKYGGGKFVAPAQRLVDFSQGKFSSSLPGCSYLPGIHPAPLNEILPDFIFQSLQTAMGEFGKKMPGRHGRSGFFTNEAVVVATESRTSSPVRIPRDEKELHHPQIENLYPCGEGAGYAGGIMSAAMDGERSANAIYKKLINQ